MRSDRLREREREPEDGKRPRKKSEHRRRDPSNRNEIAASRLLTNPITTKGQFFNTGNMLLNRIETVVQSFDHGIPGIFP